MSILLIVNVIKNYMLVYLTGALYNSIFQSGLFQTVDYITKRRIKIYNLTKNQLEN